jgi:hypothetical protein
LLTAGLAAVVPSALSADPKPWTQTPRDRESVASVWVYLDAKDCAGAVRVLNEGVAKGHPTVMLMAGAMFESGICVKQNWDRAVNFYQRAEAQGHPSAGARLAAGFAAPVGGQDKAAALWWALKAGLMLPEACRSAEPLVSDADRFVADLRSWPAGLVDACSYVAGVMGSIRGDAEFSSRAAAFGMKGTVKLVFEPARGAIDVDTTSIEFIQLGGVVSGNTLLDRQSKDAKKEFERDLRRAADRALERFAMPGGINPSWKLTYAFIFDYVN